MIKHPFKNLKIIVALGMVITTIAGCSGLDVVGKQSITSFEAIVSALPNNVTPDEANGGYSLSSPDGAVRFIWSKDYSSSTTNDVMLELDSAPFIQAGLDTSKLPENYRVDGEKLIVGKKLGSDKITYSGEPTAISAYEEIVNRYRASINFHTSLDHYGVMLGDGNMFEWAKDTAKNSATGEVQDKDIVFVLNPEPLINAGVDPQKVTSWAYAQVEVDDNGKTVQVWKFLKPFDIL
jgi:hypothetical protein